jgi:hypothetical protein
MAVSVDLLGLSVAEPGCIFTTEDLPGEAAKELSAAKGSRSDRIVTTWICVEYDPAAFRIGYVWVKPGRVATELRIRLSRGENGDTLSHICFRYTGLTPEGNEEVAGYDREWFERKMRSWETAINHYLRTGAMIAA